MLSTVRIVSSSCCELIEGEQHGNSEPTPPSHPKKKKKTYTSQRGKSETLRGEYTENYKERDQEGELTVSSLMASAEMLVVCPAN